MAGRPLEATVKNIDTRLARVEQILPTLATKDEIQALRADLERFATKKDLEQFATQKDLERFATKEDLERFATKEDLKAFPTREEMFEEGRSTRRHFDAVAERLEAQIKLLAEGQVALSDRMDRRFDEAGKILANHERRITRLEARQP